MLNINNGRESLQCVMTAQWPIELRKKAPSEKNSHQQGQSQGEMASQQYTAGIGLSSGGRESKEKGSIASISGFLVISYSAILQYRKHSQSS